MSEASGLKNCRGCGPKPRAEFGRDFGASDGLKARCRACIREAEKRRYHLKKIYTKTFTSTGGSLIGSTEEERLEIEANYRIVKAEKDSINDALRVRRERAKCFTELDQINRILGTPDINIPHGHFNATIKDCYCDDSVKLVGHSRGGEGE